MDFIKIIEVFTAIISADIGNYSKFILMIAVVLPIIVKVAKDIVTTYYDAKEKARADKVNNAKAEVEIAKAKEELKKFNKKNE